MAEPLHRSEKAKAQILRAHVAGQILQQRLVLGTDRTQSDEGPVAQPFRGFELPWVRRYGEPRLSGLRKRDPQPGIDRHHPGGAGEQWVDVELANFGMVDRELSDPDQDFSDRINGRRRPAAIPLQQPPHARARHHRVRQRLIERRECQRSIPDLFDRRTAVGRTSLPDRIPGPRQSR